MILRETCGTLRGALAHQAARESLCGWCTHAEAVAQASAEGIPQRPSPVWPPVTPGEARTHAEILNTEVAQYELDHPTGRGIYTADELGGPAREAECRVMTKTDRRDIYAEYRAKGEDQVCAALRIPVSPRTARRYEAELRRIREARPAA